MGDTDRSSILVHLLVIALCLTAFGFAIAAERRRSTGSIVTDNFNSTFCVYDSDIATGYGVGAFLFLLSSQSLLMVVTKVTFIIAESCLIGGATKNAYHTKYRHMVYAGSWTCESLRKGVFIAGAVFVVFTMILNVYFYMYYTKSTSQAAKNINRTTPNVGMTGYA
uniref:Fiber protein Fb34 n=1 Tax=Leersia perrieri TaxID=77586 RepID=A0A0D9WQ97_9ORYZ